MVDSKNRLLVSQSFGRESEYKRVSLTLLSFYAQMGHTDIRSILFTDRPDWFAQILHGLPVEFVLLTPEKIKQMRGSIDFLHRMKIAMIEEVFHRYQEANLLYVDSDTFFIRNPTPLFTAMEGGQCFMHLREFEFEEVRHAGGYTGAKFSAYLRLMEQKPFFTSKGAEQFTARNASWNAGVMGLPNFIKSDIPDVYAITEQSFPETDNHASEQFAFSFVLQSRYPLNACDEYVYHYWYVTKKKIVDLFTHKKVNKLFMQAPLEQRLLTVKKWTEQLPKYFNRHILHYKDKSMLALDEDKVLAGYKWATRAMLKGGIFDVQFLRDIMYHNKRFLKKVSKKAIGIK